MSPDESRDAIRSGPTRRAPVIQTAGRWLQNRRAAPFTTALQLGTPRCQVSDDVRCLPPGSHQTEVRYSMLDGV